MSQEDRFQFEHIVFQVIAEAVATGRTIAEILEAVRTEAVTHYESYVSNSLGFARPMNPERGADDASGKGRRPGVGASDSQPLSFDKLVWIAKHTNHLSSAGVGLGASGWHESGECPLCDALRRAEQ